MKAFIFDKKNPAEPLVLRETEKPSPAGNEVLVKIAAVAVNAADYRSMKMGIIPKNKIFGSEIAGRVETAGENAVMFKAGDEVFGDTSFYGFGGFAEYASVPERALVLKPAGVSFETAAAVPMTAVTALQALRNKGNIQPGQKVLICGAGGGVGTFAVQLAKYFGAEVTAVCGEKNVGVMQSLGAGHVINYHVSDFAESEERYDLILAVNGNRPLVTYKRLLAPKGIFVMVGGPFLQVLKAMLTGPLMSAGSKKMRVLASKASRADLEFIIRLAEEGKVNPVIDRRYPFSRTAEAVRYLSGGHALGKVIITAEPDGL